MKLTDSEKREVLKLLEADRPLPDRRYKLAVKPIDILCNDTMKIVELGT